MAKIQKISNIREDEEDEIQEEHVHEAPVSQTQPDDALMALAQSIQSLNTRLDASDMALMEVSSEIQRLTSIVDRILVRLDEEKEVRLRAQADVIANMDQESLSLRVLDICINKYLDYEANNFERLANDPVIARSGMQWLVRAHRNMVSGIEHALRMG